MIDITKVKNLYKAGKTPQQIAMNIYCELKAKNIHDVTIDDIQILIENVILKEQKYK